MPSTFYGSEILIKDAEYNTPFTSETILSISSITLSFFVATAIGLIFGIAPAKSAANKRPIEAIRYD